MPNEVTNEVNVPFTFHLSPFTFHLSPFTSAVPNVITVRWFDSRKQQALLIFPVFTFATFHLSPFTNAVSNVTTVRRFDLRKALSTFTFPAFLIYRTLM